MTFTPAGKTKDKKYIMASVPYEVINYHGKYTAFQQITLLFKSKIDKTENK